MKVLFISVNTESVNMPTLPLGLACVATATRRAGHQVKLIDFTAIKGLREVIRETVTIFRPDTIGIAVRNIDDQCMVDTQFFLGQVKEVINCCRSSTTAPIILGGAGYSMYPESALVYLGADMGIKGEGEVVFPDLVDRIQQGKDVSDLPGLYLPGQGTKTESRYVQDLDLLAFPDEQLWHVSDLVKQQDTWIPLQTRRGCPMDCIYCSTASIEGRARREHKPEAVVEMISRYVRGGFTRFYFTDNTFNIPSSYAAEICHRILALKLELSWMCILYPWDIKKDLVRDIARAGCREVSLGFESGNQTMLTSMNKKFSLEEIMKTSRILQDYKISQMGFLLLGGPGETRLSVTESLAFADSLPLDRLKITAGVRIYPDTRLSKLALREGAIKADDDLLHPRFYLAKGLEGWLQETVEEWMRERPHWST